MMIVGLNGKSFDLLTYYYYGRDWNIKVVNHISNLKGELYKLLGVEKNVN